MGASTYIALIFGITIAFMLIGYATNTDQYQTGITVLQQYGLFSSEFGSKILQLFIAALTNPANWALIGGAFLITFATGGGFSVMYLIPLLILIPLINVFVLPANLFTSVPGGIPDLLNQIILGVFNILLFMLILTFIRGGD